MSSENASSSCDIGTLQLPISRIKTIMKSSPEVSAIGTESLFLIAKATVRLSVHCHPSLFERNWKSRETR